MHKKKAEVANQIGANSCPKCGGELIARKGKYGYFKECNNYPKCSLQLLISSKTVFPLPIIHKP
ncbi:MAG TPA: hypothetical protein DEF89_00945 [Desulfosporosinus sp.]|nr:hypothetical protein [Desulfosporosinus sp.]